MRAKSLLMIFITQPIFNLYSSSEDEKCEKRKAISSKWVEWLTFLLFRYDIESDCCHTTLQNYTFCALILNVFFSLVDKKNVSREIDEDKIQA